MQFNNKNQHNFQCSKRVWAKTIWEAFNGNIGKVYRLWEKISQRRGAKNRVNRAKITKLSEVHWENIVKVQNCPEIGEGEVKKTS